MLAKRIGRSFVPKLLIGLGVIVLGANTYSDAVAAENPPPAPPVAPVIDVDNNPYIELYKLRVAETESTLRRQQALADLAQSKLERGRRLISQNAISREEYDTLVSDAAVTSADIDLAAKKLDESKAYLKIVTALVKRGVTIPLCTYEMN